MAAVAFLFAPPQAPAQSKTSGVHECAGGITVRLVPVSAMQGGVLRLEVHSAAPLANVTGTWTQRDAERAVPFWRDARYKNFFHGFLGIDLEKPAGKYELKLNVQPEAGDAVSCVVPVAVAPGKLALEKLTVAPEFVEPNAEEAKRAQEEG